MARQGIEELFSNQVLTDLLTIFMLHPDETYHQRQLAAILSRSRRPVQLNLKRLENLGIISSRMDGNRIAYSCDKSSPLFQELRRIILKTVGFGSLLKEGLGELVDQIEVAFIYGSIAEGTDNIGSDIDVLIIGDISTREAVSALSQVKKEIKREINVNVYSRQEFGKKYTSGNHFVRSVVDVDKLYLIGDDEQLRTLCA